MREEDLLKLRLERDVADMRLELLRENQALRHELDALKAESTRLLSDVENKIANAEDKITEKAIDKTLGVLQHMKGWITLFAVGLSALLALGTFFGVQNYISSMTSSFNSSLNTRIDNWMRFEDKDSEGARALDQQRTRAMLDAYMTKIARDRASHGTMSFPLSVAESSRLMLILKNPDSELSDFSDALTIIVRSRGFLAPRWGDDPVGKQLIEVLNDKNLSTTKRGLAFEQLKDDVVLLGYSSQVVDDPKASFVDKMTAFENLRVNDEVRALAFAKDARPEDSTDQLRLALYVAKQTGDFQRVRDFVAALPEHPVRDGSLRWQPTVQDVLAGVGEALSDMYPAPAEEIGPLIARVIDQGAVIRLSDMFDNQRIVLASGNQEASMIWPGRWMKSQPVISQAILSKPLTVDWLRQVANFFQIADGAYQLTTLQVTLGEHDSLQAGAGPVAASDIQGKLWLRVEPAPGGKLLKATWRDAASGVVQERVVDTDQSWRTAQFALSFDPKLVERLSYDPASYRYR